MSARSRVDKVGTRKSPFRAVAATNNHHTYTLEGQAFPCTVNKEKKNKTKKCKTKTKKNVRDFDRLKRESLP